MAVPIAKNVAIRVPLLHPFETGRTSPLRMASINNPVVGRRKKKSGTPSESVL